MGLEHRPGQHQAKHLPTLPLAGVKFERDEIEELNIRYRLSRIAQRANFLFANHPDRLTRRERLTISDSVQRTVTMLGPHDEEVHAQAGFWAGRLVSVTFSQASGMTTQPVFTIKEIERDKLKPLRNQLPLVALEVPGIFFETETETGTDTMVVRPDYVGLIHKVPLTTARAYLELNTINCFGPLSQYGFSTGDPDLNARNRRNLQRGERVAVYDRDADMFLHGSYTYDQFGIRLGYEVGRSQQEIIREDTQINLTHIRPGEVLINALSQLTQWSQWPRS